MDRKTIDFFVANARIKGIAWAAKEKLLGYFPGATIYFMYDIDTTIKKEFVWVIIKTQKSYEEAYNILEEFDHNWWIAKLPYCEGKLAISVRARESYY